VTQYTVGYFGGGVSSIGIIIQNLYSSIMPLGGYRGAGGTGR